MPPNVRRLASASSAHHLRPDFACSQSHYTRNTQNKVGYRQRSGDASKERNYSAGRIPPGPHVGGHPREQEQTVSSRFRQAGGPEQSSRGSPAATRGGRIGHRQALDFG